MSELRAISFGVVFYEPLVENILSSYRKNNKYCKSNTSYSSALSQIGYDLDLVWAYICGITNPRDLRDFMQSRIGDHNDRYVLWNFDNIYGSGSGTVEFRGGRGLRGPVRTKRLISFVVAFVYLCISYVPVSGFLPTGTLTTY